MSEYPKRLRIATAPRLEHGTLVDQPDVVIFVKNADEEARWLPAARHADPAPDADREA